MTSPQSGECPKCREQNLYTLSFCSFCGDRLPWAPSNRTPVGPEPYNNSIAAHDGPSQLFFVASVLIPFCGLILYNSEKNVAPLRAASARKGLLVGCGPQLVFASLAVMWYVNALQNQTARYYSSPVPIETPSAASRAFGDKFVRDYEKKQAEKQAVALVNQQLKEKGSNLHCVQVVLRDSVTGDFTGEARLNNGTTVQIELKAKSRSIQGIPVR